MSKPHSLIFAYAPPGDAWASAHLRGGQMMQLIREVRNDVECKAESLAGLQRRRGACVILTKSALHEVRPGTIAKLRARGHRLIADFVDLPVDPKIAACMDCLLASSVAQARFMRGRFPQIPVLHVTHHADLRLPPVLPLTDRPRFGYFGKPENCLHARAIRHLVDIVPAENFANLHWMLRLPQCNAHYVLRSPEAANVFKPFVKGFVAAHCGVPVIAAANDEEARHYLGADYPFFVDDLSLASTYAQLDHFAGAFATPAWASAVAMMRDVALRAGRAAIKQELDVFLDAVIFRLCR
jgi:hypothetical protein